MTLTSGSRAPVTELNQQALRLVGELKRLFNVFLNCMFSLAPKGTRRRRRMLIGMFILIGFLFGFFSREVSVWLAYFQNLLVFLLNPKAAAGFTTNPIRDFLQLILDTYKNPAVFRFLPIFILPFVLALQLASIYLADIFELEEVSTARTFIMQVAIIGGSRRIRIRDGEIDQESEQSPVFLIGGPGSVIVELDSAALFERSDGSPHVIGSTIDGPVVLEGFERFRQAINLHDHRTETLKVSSRSSDGIPVQAGDVSFLFSVVRGNSQPSSALHPYPFSNNNVIETLIYNQGAKVTESGPRPADISRAWAGTMTGLIRNALGIFMSEHNLTEYLASHGEPEVRSANAQTIAILQSAQRILPPEGPLPPLGDMQDVPAFIPRPDIRAQLFGEFAEAFPGIASQRGVELHWVGIGSWKTPSQIVPEQHLEAWQLSLDNQARQANVTPIPPISNLIQDVPLTRFTESRQRQRTHHETMLGLLVGYREHYMKILNIMDKKDETRNYVGMNRILRALRHINRILGLPDNFPAHWAGRNGNQRPPGAGGAPVVGPIPPAPGTQPGPEAGAQAHSQHSFTTEEEKLFLNLAMKTRNVPTAERLVEHERSLTPHASVLELIQRAIEKWERDNL